MLALSTATATFLAPASSVVRTRAPMVRMAERCEMDPAVLERYMALPVSGKVQAEYLFIDKVRA